MPWTDLNSFFETSLLTVVIDISVRSVDAQPARSRKLACWRERPARFGLGLGHSSNMTAPCILRRGDVKNRQVCAGAPWVIQVVGACGGLPAALGTSTGRPHRTEIWGLRYLSAEGVP